MCKIYRFMYFILPFRNIKSVLIKKHFSVCKNCQKNIQLKVPLSEVENVKVWAQKETSLWPEIISGFQNLKQKKAEPKKTLISRPFKIWRWATAFITLAIFVAIGFLIQKGLKREVPSEELLLTKSPQKVIVKRAEVKGKKAKPIIYQTSTVSIIFLIEDKEPGG